MDLIAEPWALEAGTYQLGEFPNGWAEWNVTLLAFVSAVVGCICLAGGLHGYLLAAARLWERAVLIVAGVLLIVPELVTSLVGLALLGVVVAVQLPRRLVASPA